MSDGNPSAHRRHRSERDQFDLFRALPGDVAPRDRQDLMAGPFCWLAKSRRIIPVDFRARMVTIRAEAVAKQGLAAISDAHVLISAAPCRWRAKGCGCWPKCNTRCSFLLSWLISVSPQSRRIAILTLCP